MKKYLSFVLLSGFLSFAANAEDIPVADIAAVKDSKVETNKADDSAQGSDWSFGFQAAPLVFGLSVRRNLNDVWQVQGMLAPYGDEVAVAARVLRVSTRKQYWHSYLFSGLAIKNSDSYFYDDNSFTDEIEKYTESVATIGLGVEWAWGAKNPSLPPLSWSLELGLGYANESYKNSSISNNGKAFLAFGAGIHYQFE